MYNFSTSKFSTSRKIDQCKCTSRISTSRKVNCIFIYLTLHFFLFLSQLYIQQNRLRSFWESNFSFFRFLNKTLAKFSENLESCYLLHLNHFDRNFFDFHRVVSEIKASRFLGIEKGDFVFFTRVRIVLKFFLCVCEF